ncbi:restriction endonuclease subunit S [Neptuniibacter halophilus]|uniref:restriction endonuclease subunit S n=1 Tax=Neptuniibacter halophilus TaxID=651666 RepID=UPI002572810B|nr:restriction endonuclease subunit S [Neptuniibacter halophilus]
MGSANVEQLITDHIDLWTSAIENKSSSGRGGSKKKSLYGIKKLRELILELAVRGKLIPQDPNDEPASVLLERIADKKDSLIRAKAIKKPRRLPEITEEDCLEHLPAGWARCRLGSVMNVLNGRAYKKHEMLQEGTPLLRVGNLFTSKEWYYSDLELEPDKYIDTGDLIYAWSASFGPFIWDGGKAIYHYHIWKLDFFNEESLYKPFIFNFLSAITEEIKASGNGIAMVHMTKDRMEKLILRIPPYSEQIRISEKVAELMALCDQLEEQTENNIEAHQVLVETLLGTLTLSQNAEELAENWERVAEHFDTLFTTEHSIDQLKQTILQLAVMGKLVAQDPKDEPASVLLERIAAEKEQLIKDKKIKRSKSLPLVGSEEKNHDIPVAWQWVRFSDVASCRLGKMLDKAKNKGELLPYLRNTNVQWKYCDLEDVKQMRFEESEKEEFLIKVGDLLICEGGEPGRCAIWNEPDNEIYFQKALHRARPFQGVLAEYLQICLRKDAISKQLDKYFTGATIKHFPGDKLARYVVPMPPQKEQIRLVAKVNQLLTICDQLKARLLETQQNQLSLAEAITDQVLQGEALLG